MDALYAAERDKYEKMYRIPGYDTGPGRSYVPKALRYINHGSSVIDFGCGSGDAANLLASMGHDVQLVDITVSVRPKYDLHFFQASLHDLPDELRPADWGFCTDVMEHLPTEWIGQALRCMSSKVRNCFFSISGNPDGWGQHIGERLHLTVKPAEWWIQEISNFWRSVERINQSDSIFEFVARTAYARD